MSSSRISTSLSVQDLVGEAVALHPAGVHAVEHLGPVLGLGAAGAGVELEDGVGAVVLPGEEGVQVGLLHLLLQAVIALGDLGEQGVVVLLHGHLHQGGQILPLPLQTVKFPDLALELLGAAQHLLAVLPVVPEAVLGGLGLQLRELSPGVLQVQGRGQLGQLRPHGPQFLLIGIVFDNGHGFHSKSQYFPPIISKQSCSVKRKVTGFPLVNGLSSCYDGR